MCVHLFGDGGVSQEKSYSLYDSENVDKSGRPLKNISLKCIY